MVPLAIVNDDEQTNHDGEVDQQFGNFPDVVDPPSTSEYGEVIFIHSD